MPSFNPFTSVVGRSAFTLFDIRLDNDFLVYRGNEHESSGQMLKGTVVLCVSAPTKIEDVHLRLIGTHRLSWTDYKVTPSGLSNQKTDRTKIIINHRFDTLWGTPGKSSVLEKGNYEFPFELLLEGDTAESVEGLHEASITYRLKATVARGKLNHDLHAYRPVRVIRTLESSALEFLHAMSVENIWPNKVEYSILVPQKAIVFGSAIPIETRFTPLLKGLDIEEITVKLVEIHEFTVQSSSGHPIREHRKEREVTTWTLPVSKEEHWQDMIEDTGQEGWLVNSVLDLPKKLGKCIQDVNVHGIKIRHKLKMVVALKNPDGHVSELRATLPVTIFISPNIPLDEEGNLASPSQVPSSAHETTSIAPPGYGEHVLDQLYDEVETGGFQTPAVQSGMNSPLYSQSRNGSSENLGAVLHGASEPGVLPSALVSRLQDVSVGSSNRNVRFASGFSGSGETTPYARHVHGPESSDPTPPDSAPLSRQHSDESTGRISPEHVELEMQELCKVPSYRTAIKTAAPHHATRGPKLPDYHTVMSAPNTPALSTTPLADPLSNISEVPEELLDHRSEVNTTRPNTTRRQTATGVSRLYSHHGDDERRRVYLMQARERVA